MFGSDVVAETLRALDIPFVALNPGASFRGLHDSLVNHLGNERPQMLLCLHEEHAVALAQGYAKVTGKPLAVVVHSNVGLFHATMAIFNAWCDRMPVLILGATGPVDATKRRPWIDWIHTARDQGAIVRNFVKWDDQPASPSAAQESLVRANWIAKTQPMGPVYVNLDVSIQEMPIQNGSTVFDVAAHMPVVSYSPSDEVLRDIASRLQAATNPVILVGRVSRSEEAWAQRIALAEALGAKTLTDLKVGAGFPTDHPLSFAAPSVFPTSETMATIAVSDLVLSLDWVALRGILPENVGEAPPIIHVSLDHHIHNGWSMDHQALPPVGTHVAADPDAVVAGLCNILDLPPVLDPTERSRPAGPQQQLYADPAHPLAVADLALLLRTAVGSRDVSLLHLPLSWNGEWWPFRHPLDFIGSDGGGGIGGGPGISVGAALALRGSGRLPVSICGDGDFLMGVTAIWTAVHYGIPLLVVVANNRSYFNDEVHQERMATERGRPVENKWIGQKMIDPDIDVSAMAAAQGATGFGPIHDSEKLTDAYENAIKIVEQGGVAVLDVRVEPGYTPSMVGGLTSGGGRQK